MTIILDRGNHKNPEDGTCIMEAVSLVAGENFTDMPDCADWGLAGVSMNLNDLMDRVERQRLVPYIHRLLDSRQDSQDEDPQRYALGWMDIAEVLLASREGDQDWVESARGINAKKAMESGTRHFSLGTYTGATTWFQSVAVATVRVDADPWGGGLDVEKTLEQFELLFNLFEQVFDHTPSGITDEEIAEAIVATRHAHRQAEAVGA